MRKNRLVLASAWTLLAALATMGAGCGDEGSTTIPSGAGGSAGSGGAGASGGSGGAGGAGGEACTPAAEVCDGQDNNCDGAIDEGCECLPGETQNCYTGPTGTENVGECKNGQQTCSSDGKWETCTGEVLPVDEVCDAVDNNCDGMTDEGCQCLPGDMQECYSGPDLTKNVGACLAGTQTCDANGQWETTCAGEVLPADEVCDGIDNNCDGVVDDNDPGGSEMCNTGALGVCAAGTTSCVDGKIVCNQNVQASAEQCDGLDNDCDGTADNGEPGSGMACSTGQQGVCSAGTTACMGGMIVCNQNVQPTAEQCDGLDNDCDGMSDDDNPGSGMMCNTGKLGICSAGLTACTGGSIVCNQNAQPTAEACDGLDNDCNGIVDDGNPGSGQSCSTGLQGVCGSGVTNCSNGQILCVQNVQPTAEVCDNLDNDCDGTADEGNPGAGANCNTGKQGACAAGTTACTGGLIVCNQNTNSSPEVCDTIDNDCDGQADDLGANDPTGTCAHNVCSTGTSLTASCDSCVAAICAADSFCCTNSWDSVCVGEVASVCNLDCLGTCQTGLQGICATGNETCSNGTISCVGPQPVAEICADNLDNDCDGTVNDGCGCAHDKCTTGVALASGCDPCVTQICAVDSFCCTNSWDSICVGEVSSVCGLTCP